MPLHRSHVLLHLVEQLLNFATARLSELAPLVLLHPHSADLAGPVVDVLEKVPVNRLQVLDTERALDVDETGTELLRPGRGGCAFPDVEPVSVTLPELIAQRALLRGRIVRLGIEVRLPSFPACGHVNWQFGPRLRGPRNGSNTRRSRCVRG